MKKLKAMVGALLAVGLVAGAPVSAYAQNDPRDQMIERLQLQDADIRDALRELFRNVGVSYTISMEVQGTVTASFERPTPFETVLRNLLGQVNATYRVEGGVFNIIPRPMDQGFDPGTGGQQQTLPPAAQTRIHRLQIRHADPQLIYLLLRGEMGFGQGPEISTLDLGTVGGGAGGFGGGGGGFGQGGFGGGGFGGGGFGGGGFGGGGFGGGGFGGGGQGGFGGGGFGGGPGIGGGGGGGRGGR